MGKVFALASAFIWALAVILFKKSGEKVAPFSLNLFRVAVSAVLLLITLSVMDEPLWGRAPWEDYAILFLSGIIAIAVSDTLFHKSLNIVGAGISAIVDCLYSPLVVILAFFMIGERFSLLQIIGMVFVLSGILVAASHEPPAGVTPRKLVFGIVLGVFSMITLAVGIVIAKPVLDRSSVLWATTVRQIGCLIVMLPLAFVSPNRWEILSVFKPTTTWKYSLTGAVLGSYMALIFWIAGMKYTLAGTAAMLNQSSTIFIVVFAALFLREKFTVKKLIALLLAFIGIVLVTIG